MKICVFTYAYPGKHDTAHFAFVKQLVDAIAAEGNECHVVSPYNILHYRKLANKIEKYKVKEGEVTVYRPYFLSFSKIVLFRIIASHSRRIALRQAVKQLPKDIEIVYGHFWSSGYEAYPYARSNNLPLFVASGESKITSLFKMPTDIKAFSEYVSGVICVSRKNRDESIELGLTTDKKCGIFPNAVNSKLFHELDKIECRRRIGIPQDEFVIAFVGWFNERKGVQRLAKALSIAKGVKSIFIGKGAYEPEIEGVLFKGFLPHEQIPLYLNAADCFVLPTFAEGCCNAVVEAMACGLPIVSSNLPFNWDVLDRTNSILLDPNSIEDIANAIITLRDDRDLLNRLRKGALQKAQSLTIEKRAISIIQFMEEMISSKDQ